VNEEVKRALKTCPRCHKEYIGYPALSRVDNKTPICSDCGREEARMGLARSLEKHPMHLSRTEIVCKAYDLASLILESRANDGTITERLESEGWTFDDIARVENELRKIAHRLASHKGDLKLK
jgi:hypothetical protein